MEKRATVTLITDNENIVFIKRKKRDDDPWSGHIAFPGGYVKEGESDLEASKRECDEEIGFTPSVPRFHGRFSTHIKKLEVSAFVSVENVFHEYRAGNEVDSVFILNLKEMEESRTSFDFPCYHAKDYEIWGLTYRILQSYFSE